jgi:hypothetical protein
VSAGRFHSGNLGGENQKITAVYHRFHHTGGMSVSAHTVFQYSASFFGDT